MANNDSRVQFRPESSNVQFQPDSSFAQSEDRGSWRAFGGDNFSWNKAAIGVGTVAAVAGAAYVASRYIGRGSYQDERSERFERESAFT